MSGKTIKIGNRFVGEGQPSFIIAELGINHNGDMATARKLIVAAALAGSDAVKFQKRTVDVVYSAEELAKPRESRFGPTNGDLKRGLEFGREQYEADRCILQDPGNHVVCILLGRGRRGFHGGV